MEAEFFAACLRPLDVSLRPEVARRMLIFLDELLRWNRRINLTAITNREEAIEKHLVDSLTLIPLLRGDERVLDLGSGGGFPGLPLQIAMPELRITSVDAVQKKIMFQRHVTRLLGLEGFAAVHVRGEDLPGSEACVAGFDVIVSRAFASLPAFVAMALPCLAADGRIVAMKGAEGERELAEARQELTRIGVVCREVKRLRLPVSGAERVLLLFARA